MQTEATTHAEQDRRPYLSAMAEATIAAYVDRPNAMLVLAGVDPDGGMTCFTQRPTPEQLVALARCLLDQAADQLEDQDELSEERELLLEDVREARRHLPDEGEGEDEEPATTSQERAP